MTCTRLAVLLLLWALTACAAAPAALKQSGTLPSGSTITATSRRGSISVYAPARGQPDSEYTIEVYGTEAARDTAIRVRPKHVTVSSAGLDNDVLLRGPKDAVLHVIDARGNINVADFDGVVNARTLQGDIKMMLPQYGNARAGTGNISVIFASTAWPGTLHFSSQKGDVELYVNENASAQVHLRALHGTIFTDFPLKGTAHGSSEEINGSINGGSKRGIDVFVRDGSIRLLQLKPQV